MLQLEDRLSADVDPSGHVSLLLELKVSRALLAHRARYFVKCWLFSCYQFEGESACVGLSPQVEDGSSQTSPVRG